MEFDFLRDPRFSVRALSEAIVNIPNTYDFLGTMGLFPERGIRTTTVEIEVKDLGDINVIPTNRRGAPAPRGQRGDRKIKAMPSLYFNHEDSLMADDIQNIRGFGQPNSEEFLIGFAQELAEIMEPIQHRYRTTHEYLKWGALRGDVVDNDGVTVLYNCYDEFNEQQYDFDLKLGNTGENVALKKLKEQRRWTAKNLKGEPVTGYLRLLSPQLFDGLVEHPYYAEIYQNQQEHGQHPLFNDLGLTGFKVGNEWFIEQTGEATYLADDGSSHIHSFIPDGEGIAIPLGTRQTFRSYFTPGTMFDNVNLPGLSMYMSTKVLDHNRGVEVFTESAPVFVVQKPRLVHRIWSSNGLAPAA